jgi:hypothetical protein
MIRVSLRAPRTNRARSLKSSRGFNRIIAHSPHPELT